MHVGPATAVTERVGLVVGKGGPAGHQGHKDHWQNTGFAASGVHIDLVV